MGSAMFEWSCALPSLQLQPAAPSRHVHALLNVMCVRLHTLRAACCRSCYCSSRLLQPTHVTRLAPYDGMLSLGQVLGISSQPAHQHHQRPVSFILQTAFSGCAGPETADTLTWLCSSQPLLLPLLLLL